ncbi:XRE family transcriptional regulator [Nocardia sp. CDC153]|uniref:helix-turn-helix domain-containing protein n=1 Tax=Nocardia sp. CDC153 TaxID=3112167 RepID=UPI002DBA2DAE|nr:XRE family transcriptional regulator [Nocardia sp. CDC153]MEC3957610.1 XRE family transcriptional regulator [Nocardia sp. CDC153]
MPEREIDARWIGRRIAQLRGERGWTLAALADRVDLSATQLSRIESSTRQPSLGTLIELARTFGIGLSQLVDGEPTAEYHLVRRADRLSKNLTDSELSTLSWDFPDIEALHVILEPASATPEAEHSGRDLLCVITGSVRVTINTDTLDLDRGDALRFSAHLPHVISNDSAETAEVMIIRIHPAGPHRGRASYGNL